MKTIELIAGVDEGRWMQGVAREWAEGPADTREDLYTLEDGQPVEAPR